MALTSAKLSTKSAAGSGKDVETAVDDVYDAEAVRRAAAAASTPSHRARIKVRLT